MHPSVGALDPDDDTCSRRPVRNAPITGPVVRRERVLDDQRRPSSTLGSVLPIGAGTLGRGRTETRSSLPPMAELGFFRQDGVTEPTSTGSGGWPSPIRSGSAEHPRRPETPLASCCRGQPDQPRPAGARPGAGRHRRRGPAQRHRDAGARTSAPADRALPHAHQPPPRRSRDRLHRQRQRRQGARRPRALRRRARRRPPTEIERARRPALRGRHDRRLAARAPSCTAGQPDTRPGRPHRRRADALHVGHDGTSPRA